MAAVLEIEHREGRVDGVGRQLGAHCNYLVEGRWWLGSGLQDRVLGSGQNLEIF